MQTRAEEEILGVSTCTSNAADTDELGIYIHEQPPCSRESITYRGKAANATVFKCNKTERKRLETETANDKKR